MIKKLTTKKQPLEVVSPSKLKELDRVIKHPTVLGFLEFATGAFGTKKTDLLMTAGRIGQAAFKGEALRQLGIEIFELRKKGKINDQYIESDYGKKTFVDLLKAIDDENIDPKKWEAIKKVFYHSISSSGNEIERKKAYYVMQICLQLKAFDIEVLGFVHSTYSTPNNGTDAITAAGDWLRKVSAGLGYDLPWFVEESEERLINLGVLTGRRHGDRSGIVKGNTFRLTPQGIYLCEIILNTF